LPISRNGVASKIGRFRKQGWLKNQKGAQKPLSAHRRLWMVLPTRDGTPSYEDQQFSNKVAHKTILSAFHCGGYTGSNPLGQAEIAQSATISRQERSIGRQNPGFAMCHEVVSPNGR
jgi:hypothetical protein